MSLALLKNLFFQRTETPAARRSRSFGNGTFPSDLTGSRRPLLASEEAAQRRISEEYVRDDASSGDETVVDLESQIIGEVSRRREKETQGKAPRFNTSLIKDATIGLSDGLTVPFALTAGLSALGSTKFVIYGGFAELIAGAISMGLGGYLGARSESDAYKSLKEEMESRIATDLPSVMDELMQVFEGYGCPKRALNGLDQELARLPRLVDFVMRFQHCREEPDSIRPFISGITIGFAYFLGGFLPLLPYLFVGHHEVDKGLYMSIGVMVAALFMFGYAKTCAVTGSWFGEKDIRVGCFEGVQMVVVGSVAAAAAMGSVKLFSHDEPSMGCVPA